MYIWPLKLFCTHLNVISTCTCCVATHHKLRSQYFLLITPNSNSVPPKLWFPYFRTWQLPLYHLPLYTGLIQIPHRSVFSFCNQLVHFNMRFSRVISLVYAKVSFLRKDESCSFLCIIHNFYAFIHLWTFKLFLNYYEYGSYEYWYKRSSEDPIFTFCDAIKHSNGLLDHMIILFVIFWGSKSWYFNISPLCLIPKNRAKMCWHISPLGPREG